MRWLPLLVLLAVPAAAQDLPNLLTNPSVETVGDGGWAAGWEIWPQKLPEAGAVSVDSSVGHTGKRSLRLHHANAGSYTRAQQAINLEPNTRYAFTVWVKGEGITPGSGSMRARMYIEGIGGQDHATEGMDGTFDWQQLTVGPYNSGAGGRITVMCYLHQATGTVWFDDVHAFKVTPEWERMMEQKRLRAGLDAEVRLAEQAARGAGDQAALAALQAFRDRAGGAQELGSKPDPRQGPPYSALDAEVFAVAAQVNARRLGPDAAVVAWQADPFAPLPPLGLVPKQRQLPANVLAATDDREQVALNLCNVTARPVRARLTCPGFTGAGAPVLTLREAVHVETGPGTLLADPLPRLGSPARMTLPPGVFRQLWCDISTAGCQPGTYRTTVTISVARQRDLVCPITVRVLPVKLPAMAPIATWNYSYQHWPLIQSRWEQARDDLVAHRINSYCWPSDTLPWPQFDAQGKLLPLDWTAFDRAVATHGPVQWLLLWPGFDWPKNVALRQDLEPGSPVWEDRFIQWFRAMIAGLKERGFGYDRVAWYLRDEPTTMPVADVVALTGAAVHKADPQALIVENPYNAATMAMLERMNPVVDIWCPALPWPQGDLLKWFQDQSKKSGILWTYQVLSKDSPAFTSYRLSFWDCWRKGMTGHGFWDYADAPGDNWGPYPPNSASYAVIYGGDPDELIPSRRWEAWREGTEDYTMLWLLKERRASSPLLWDEVTKLFDQPTPESCSALRDRVLLELAH